MSPVTAIRLVFGALFVGGYMLIQLGIFGQVSSVSKALSGEEAVFGGTPVAEAKGIPGKIGWVGEKMNGMLNIGMRNEGQKVQALLNPDLYNEDRYMIFDFLISLDDVLRPGEAPPAPELEQVMVEARAGDMAMQTCARDFIGTLVRGCALIRADTSRIYVAEDGRTFSKPDDDVPTQQQWQVKAQMAFLPTILPGDTSDKAGWAIESNWGGRGFTAVVENTPEARARARREVLAASRLFCESFRDTHGTCILNQLTIQEEVRVKRKGSRTLLKDIAERNMEVVVSARPSFHWLRAPSIPQENLAMELAMAQNPALPILGKYHPPEARPTKLYQEHLMRKKRAEEMERLKAERLEKARLKAEAEANGETFEEKAAKPKLNGGKALNGGSFKPKGNAMNSGGIKFKSVE